MTVENIIIKDVIFFYERELFVDVISEAPPIKLIYLRTRLGLAGSAVRTMLVKL